MLVDDDTLARARRHHRDSIERLLAAAYPAVHRMALALAGREDVGRGITRFVINQAIPRIGRFRDPDAAARWFHHHTVLTARRAARHEPSAQDDVLIPHASADHAYTAFIRALRGLPQQQREAFILHHGESMDLRQLAIAMDCSTRAANLHLQAADHALRAIAPADHDAFTTRMREACQQLRVDPDILLPTIRSVVGRSLLARRIRRLTQLIVGMLLLAALAYAAWRFRASIPWPITGGGSAG